MVGNCKIDRKGRKGRGIVLFQWGDENSKYEGKGVERDGDGKGRE